MVKGFSESKVKNDEPFKDLKKEKKMTIFLVEQYFDFAFGLSDYLYLMQRGKIIQEGARDNLDKKAFKKQLSI